jgi:hypothetical protein
MFIQLNNVQNLNIAGDNTKAIIFDAMVFDDVTNKERHFQFKIPTAVLNAKLIKNKKEIVLDTGKGDSIFCNKRIKQTVKLRLDFDILLSDINEDEYYKFTVIND